MYSKSMDGRNILIVEDEKKIADTLKMGLAENGFDVEVAYDGKIGYQLLMSRNFDLVILDINLPGMNGYELCKAIRNRDMNMLVIMLTSMSSLDDKIEGYDAGADDYLVKPFEFRELLLKIRALLKRTPGQAVPVGNLLKAADLEMNLDNKEVHRAGKRIKLTAKEFQLLEYLMRNKNRVVSRADLAINVWDVDFNTNTNVIDVYISYVRNKVDRDFEHKLIQTHVGMGYILKTQPN
ncbi:MAG TPA: response regulator transcription factor [Puia sp.]|nr:response regulator transcription factor [Puia sp.]